MSRAKPSHAFTLIELLVVIAIIALLIGIMAPSLSGARHVAQTARCLANQRQLVTAWTLYADDHDARAMPLAYTETTQRTEEGDHIFWWGSDGATSRTVNHAVGFIGPYLASAHDRASVFECPSQPHGSYDQQGRFDDEDTLTSTYGYNGYYLSPKHTPGWGLRIGHRPWRRLFEIRQPDALFVFADTLIRFGSRARNTALLDPPQLFRGRSGWRDNRSPTTAFRHNASPGADARAVTVRADGSARPVAPHPDALLDDIGAGSASPTNAPHYVPDWKAWIR